MKRTFLLLAALFLLQSSNAQTVTFSINSGLNDPEIKAKVESTVSTLLTEFNRAFKAGATPDFSRISITEGAAASARMLWKNSPFHCDEEELVEPVLTTYDGNYQIRNIPLESLNEKREPVYREMVIDVDKSGCVIRINRALEAHLYRRIMSDGSQVTDLKQREIILNYVEDFRTAYDKKDINFLEMIFSDDALIITGKVVQRKKGDNSVQVRPDIVYSKYSKKEYLDRLRDRIFPNTKYIEVTFDLVDIVKHPTIDGYYGVKVRQRYKSMFKNGSIYEDEGYLFMLWDFRDEARPQIHVRTWQPYWMDEAKTQTIAEDQIININSFRINQ